MDRPADVVPGSARVIHRIAGSVVAGVLGAVCGFLAQWPVALLSVRLNGTAARWEVQVATFRALSEGAFFGAPLAIVAYVLFFSSFPPVAVARRVPLLFAFTVLGALPGIWLGIGMLFTVVPAFLGGCVFAARGLARETGIQAHPFR